MPATLGRYRGRLGPAAGISADVSDELPGPAIVRRVLGADVAVIDDPLSFPWGAAELDDWRSPILVDLSECSEADLIALAPQLRVLTPADLVVVGSVDPEPHLALPAAALLDAAPDDPTDLLDGRRDLKLRTALLREVMMPIVVAELTEAAGIGDAARRPLTVVDLGAPDAWRAALVPRPHQHVVASVDAARPESGHIVVVDGAILGADAIAAAREIVVPGGLVLLVLDETVVASADGPTITDVLGWIDGAFGNHRVIDEVWGLHARPGLPSRGALIGVRPLSETSP